MCPPPSRNQKRTSASVCPTLPYMKGGNNFNVFNTELWNRGNGAIV